MSSINTRRATPPHRKTGSTAKRSRTRMIYAAVIALIVVVAAVFAFPYVLSGARSESVVLIPEGATENQVADTLSKYLGESYASRTIRMASLQGFNAKERFGRYTVEKGMSPLRAGRLLARGAQTPVKITVNGFRSLELMAERISLKMPFTAEEFMKAATDRDTLAKYGLTPSEALALFLDDTYFVYWDETPQEVVRKIGDNYLKVWEGERTQQAKALGITPVQAVIICSITDEETLKADEKGKIARLYLNRLQKGMKLQADPTVRFALNDFTIRRVSGRMLSTPSPYNTYRVEGLPPGPIRTTSKATIDALLRSKSSDNLYMCASDDFSGYHKFAADFATHQANARRYQQKLNEMGIR